MEKRGVAIPLESYHLARYAVQVPCYVCEQGNLFDADYCRHCQAPMALAHQANSQNVHPAMIAAVGPSGVGKTVYLGMLMDMLSRRSSGLQGLARGAFSITLQQEAVAKLARCEFPRCTHYEPDRWNWVHCQVTIPARRRPAELIMPDMSGEAISDEIEHPDSLLGVRSLLNRACGALVLVDAAKLQEGGLEPDHFTIKLLSYLHELTSDRKKSWQNRPVAIVLTKADECDECFDDPAGFAEKYAHCLWQQCRQQLRRYKFFATGIAGACAHRILPGGLHVHIPLRIEPRGIIEPFEWIVTQARL